MIDSARRYKPFKSTKTCTTLEKAVIEETVGNDVTTVADQSHHQNIASNGTLAIVKIPVDHAV